MDATLLAMAGSRRLGLTDHATAILDPEDFLPAVGQGAIAIVIRADDGRTHEAVRPILDAPTGLALAAERAFLAVLDGSCRTPIAGWARFVGDDIEFRGQELEFRGQELEFRGQVLRPDGSDSLDIVRRGPAGEAARLGREAGQALLAQMPDGFLTA